MSKTCKKCSEEFPATKEYFPTFVNKLKSGIKIGLRGSCKVCVEKRRIYNWEKNADRHLSKENEIKRCNECEKDFPATLEFFERASKNKDGLRGYCRDCRYEKYKKRSPGYLDSGVQKRMRVFHPENLTGKTTYGSLFSKYSSEEKVKLLSTIN